MQIEAVNGARHVRPLSHRLRHLPWPDPARFTGPFEILARLPGAQVTVASRDGGAIRSDTGLEIGATRRLAEIERCDLICVPGGPGVEATSVDQDFLAELKRLASGARYITSVCNGSLILGAKLLKGKRAACHWAWRDLLPTFGAIPVAERVVRDGNVITGGGVDGGHRLRADRDGRHSRRTDCAGHPAVGGISPAPPPIRSPGDRRPRDGAGLVSSRMTGRKEDFVQGARRIGGG
ncbi:MAG: DJ-1/PfpI family protein [Rhodoblastus sp.]